MKPSGDKEKIESYYLKAKTIFSKTNDMEKARIELTPLISNEEQAEFIFRWFKKKYYQEKRNKGLIYLSIGAVFILSGFIITLFNFHNNQAFGYAMYGLTTIGIAVIFVGLYSIVR